MIELIDVEQMLNLLNIEFEIKMFGDDSAVFTVKMFGVKVVFNDIYYTCIKNEWRCVIINAEDDLEKKRLETIWQLVKGGYFHYLRTNYINTFKKMLSQFNYDKQLLEERLRLYDYKPKFNYYIKLTEEALNMSALALMNLDPGFYDFLPE